MLGASGHSPAIATGRRQCARNQDHISISILSHQPAAPFHCYLVITAHHVTLPAAPPPLPHHLLLKERPPRRLLEAPPL